MTLFWVIKLYFLDAVVGSKVALIIFCKVVVEISELLPIFIQIQQNIWNEVVQFGLDVFFEVVASFCEVSHSGVVRFVSFEIHPPIE